MLDMLGGLNSAIVYWHWIVFGLVLSLSEIFVMGFVMLWFGVSAIMVGILLTMVDMSLTAQILSWIFFSVFNVVAWFKWGSPHFKHKTLSGMSRENMLAKVGTVIALNATHTGRGTLRFSAPVLGDDEWQFISEDDIEVGYRVIVKEFSGNTLIVTKYK